MKKITNSIQNQKDLVSIKLTHPHLFSSKEDLKQYMVKQGWISSDGILLTALKDLSPNLPENAQSQLNEILELRVDIDHQSIQTLLSEMRLKFGKQLKTICLRGSYAAHLINIPFQLSQLLSHLSQNDTSMRNAFDQLSESLPKREEPNDIDWADLWNNPDPDLTEIYKYYLSRPTSSRRIPYNVSGKNDYNHNNTNAIIYSFQSEGNQNIKIDRMSGWLDANPYLFTRDFFYLSLDDWNRGSIYLEEPVFSVTSFWQAVIDNFFGIVRIEKKHLNDFSSFLAAIQHLTNGLTLSMESSGVTLEEILRSFSTLTPEKIASKVLGRIKDHKVDPWEYLINVCTIISKMNMETANALFLLCQNNFYFKKHLDPGSLKCRLNTLFENAPRSFSILSEIELSEGYLSIPTLTNYNEAETKLRNILLKEKAFEILRKHALENCNFPPLEAVTILLRQLQKSQMAEEEIDEFCSLLRLPPGMTSFEKLTEAVLKTPFRAAALPIHTELRNKEMKPLLITGLEQKLSTKNYKEALQIIKTLEEMDFSPQEKQIYFKKILLTLIDEEEYKIFEKQVEKNGIKSFFDSIPDPLLEETIREHIVPKRLLSNVILKGLRLANRESNWQFINLLIKQLINHKITLNDECQKEINTFLLRADDAILDKEFISNFFSVIKKCEEQSVGLKIFQKLHLLQDDELFNKWTHHFDLLEIQSIPEEFNLEWTFALLNNSINKNSNPIPYVDHLIRNNAFTSEVVKKIISICSKKKYYHSELIDRLIQSAEKSNHDSLFNYLFKDQSPILNTKRFKLIERIETEVFEKNQNLIKEIHLDPVRIDCDSSAEGFSKLLSFLMKKKNLRKMALARLQNTNPTINLIKNRSFQKLIIKFIKNKSDEIETSNKKYTKNQFYGLLKSTLEKCFDPEKFDSIFNNLIQKNCRLALHFALYDHQEHTLQSDRILSNEDWLIMLLNESKRSDHENWLEIFNFFQSSKCNFSNPILKELYEDMLNKIAIPPNSESEITSLELLCFNIFLREKLIDNNLSPYIFKAITNLLIKWQTDKQQKRIDALLEHLFNAIRLHPNGAEEEIDDDLQSIAIMKNFLSLFALASEKMLFSKDQHKCEDSFALSLELYAKTIEWCNFQIENDDNRFEILTNTKESLLSIFNTLIGIHSTHNYSNTTEKKRFNEIFKKIIKQMTQKSYYEKFPHMQYNHLLFTDQEMSHEIFDKVLAQTPHQALAILYTVCSKSEDMKTLLKSIDLIQHCLNNPSEELPIDLLLENFQYALVNYQRANMKTTEKASDSYTSCKRISSEIYLKFAQADLIQHHYSNISNVIKNIFYNN